MKTLQGLLLPSPDSYPLDDPFSYNLTKLQRLFLHETTCVYKDRLTTKEDHQKFDSLIDEALQKHLLISLQHLHEFDIENLLPKHEESQQQ